MTDPTTSPAHPLPDGVSDTFVRPCLDCGTTIRVVASVEQPHDHKVLDDLESLPAFAWWEGFNAAAAGVVTLTADRDGWEQSSANWQQLHNNQAARRQAAEAKLAAVEARHVPWYKVNGKRQDHLVNVYGADVPAAHVCRVDGPEYERCEIDPESPDDSLHYVLACYECRAATEDGDPGYRLWPCATALAAGSLHAKVVTP